MSTPHVRTLEQMEEMLEEMNRIFREKRYRLSRGAYQKAIGLGRTLEDMPKWLVTAMYDQSSYEKAGKLQGNEAGRSKAYDAFREIEVAELTELRELLLEMKRAGDLQVL